MIRPLVERPILECDELWSFVGHKGNVVRVWLAPSWQTRRIVGLAFGDRTAQTAQKLWQSLPPDERKRAICYSDFWQPYALILPSKRRRAVGKETGETAHIGRRATPCGNVAPIWCEACYRSVKISTGMKCASACSLTTTTANSNAPNV